jgi:hypothetical protein
VNPVTVNCGVSVKESGFESCPPGFTTLTGTTPGAFL